MASKALHWNARSVLDSIKILWRHVGLNEDFVNASTLSLTGDDQRSVVPSSFHVGHLAQASTALTGLAASLLQAQRSGGRSPPPPVSVDSRHAVLGFFSEAYTLLNGHQLPQDPWDDLAGVYETADGHVRIHTNFPHHRAGILELLGCAATRSAVAEALRSRISAEFEDEATSRGMCVSAVRTFAQWDAHPQSAALRGRLPIELVKLEDHSPPRPSSQFSRDDETSPLRGLKVVELTRVIAGPVAGRALANLGASVLWITSPNLPALPVCDLDTSRGKRATQLDLETAEGRETLTRLVSDADVFLQSYRPGSLDRRGFGPKDLAKTRPGIVVANLRGYGWAGPWAEKRAFDSLVQAATGFNAEEGEAWARHQGNESNQGKATIKALPVQCLDHGAGQLLAFGIMAALYRQRTEGGSWEVRVSLAGVGQWLRDLGQLPPEEAFKGRSLPPSTSPVDGELRELVEEWKVRHREGQSSAPSLKSLTALKPAIMLNGRSRLTERALEVPGTLDCDEPVWE